MQVNQCLSNNKRYNITTLCIKMASRDCVDNPHVYGNFVTQNQRQNVNQFVREEVYTAYFGFKIGIQDTS